MANEQAVIDRITGEINHLSNVLKNGLQVGDKVQQQRKAEIKRLNQERLAEEKEIERVDAASNFGNLVIAVNMQHTDFQDRNNGLTNRVI